MSICAKILKIIHDSISDEDGDKKQLFALTLQCLGQRGQVDETELELAEKRLLREKAFRLLSELSTEARKPEFRQLLLTSNDDDMQR